MMQEMENQPFKKYDVFVYKKKSTQEYLGLRRKNDGDKPVHTYYEIVGKNKIQPLLYSEIEDYILNNKLAPRKSDEEDIF